MKNVHIIFFVIFVTISLSAGSNDKAVAKAGNRVISTAEFAERFELTPWNKEIRTVPGEISKKEFLYTLLAEKLWAQKAVELGLDTAGQVKANFKSLEKMFVKDALYRQEILNKVNADERDIKKKTYYKAHNTINCDFIKSRGQKEINAIYKALQAGVDFDTLLVARNVEEPHDTLTVRIGQLPELLEDTLYSLRPGAYTKPVNYSGLFYIIRIKNIEPISPENSNQEESIMNEAKKIVKNRLTARYYSSFMNNFFKDKTTEVNGKLFQSAAARIIAIIQSKRKNMQPDDTGKVYLDASDFIKLKKNFGQDSLKLEIIKFGKQSSTLADFLDIIHYDENAFITSDAQKIKKILDGKLKVFMEGEYLAYEGYNRNLEKLPEVKKQVQIWKDNYLYMALRSMFNDSLNITDQEAREFYDKKKNVNLQAQVNIVEVLTDNLDIVETVLNEYKNGADLHDLAAKYSKREMTKPTRGEFGFFPVTSFGEIGRIAGTMKIGELYGPVKTDEGYSVFKLIDRKEERKAEDRPFNEVKNELKKTILGMKNYHGVVNYTTKLAKEYGVSIDKKVFETIEVTNIFSVMYRYMGFGGRILGAPLISPNTEWVEPLKDFKKDNL